MSSNFDFRRLSRITNVSEVLDELDDQEICEREKVKPRKISKETPKKREKPWAGKRHKEDEF